MRVREWQDIVADVAEKDVEPDDWRAVGGDRSSGPGEDLFMGHPAVGVFQLKTYSKNPYDVRGIGTQVTNDVGDDLRGLFPDANDEGRFAIQQGPADEEEAERTADRVEEVLGAHAAAPTEPGDLFDDLMGVLNSPAFGPMDYRFDDRPDPLDDLTNTFADAQTVLETEIEELITNDRVGRGFQ